MNPFEPDAEALPDRPEQPSVHESEFSGYLRESNPAEKARGIGEARFEALNKGNKAKAERIRDNANEKIQQESPGLIKALRNRHDTFGHRNRYEQKPVAGLALSRTEFLEWGFSLLLMLGGGVLTAYVAATYIQGSGFSLATTESIWRSALFATPFLYVCWAVGQWVDRFNEPEKATAALNRIFYIGLGFGFAFLMAAGALFTPETAAIDYGSFSGDSDPALIAEVKRWLNAVLPKIGWFAFVSALAAEVCIIGALKGHATLKGKTGRPMHSDVRIDHVVATQLLDIANARERVQLHRIIRAFSYLELYEAGLALAGLEAEREMMALLWKRDVSRARATARAEAEIISLDDRRPHLHAAE